MTMDFHASKETLKSSLIKTELFRIFTMSLERNTETIHLMFILIRIWADNKKDIETVEGILNVKIGVFRHKNANVN